MGLPLAGAGACPVTAVLFEVDALLAVDAVLGEDGLEVWLVLDEHAAIPMSPVMTVTAVKKVRLLAFTCWVTPTKGHRSGTSMAWTARLRPDGDNVHWRKP
jgi:hypothetical protein